MKNIVKQLRNQKGKTQEELANAIGVTRQTIILLEKGKNTTDEIVFKVADYFDKDPREIFFTNDVVSTLQK